MNPLQAPSALDHVILRSFTPHFPTVDTLSILGFLDFRLGWVSFLIGYRYTILSTGALDLRFISTSICRLSPFLLLTCFPLLRCFPCLSSGTFGLRCITPSLCRLLPFLLLLRFSLLCLFSCFPLFSCFLLLNFCFFNCFKVCFVGATGQNCCKPTSCVWSFFRSGCRLWWRRYHKWRNIFGRLRRLRLWRRLEDLGSQVELGQMLKD